MLLANIFIALYLGGPKAEDCGLDISLVFVHQEEGLLLCQTEVLSCGHMSQPEGLTPADVTSAPSRHKNSQIYSQTYLCVNVCLYISACLFHSHNT